MTYYIARQQIFLAAGEWMTFALLASYLTNTNRINGINTFAAYNVMIIEKTIFTILGQFSSVFITKSSILNVFYDIEKSYDSIE